MARALVAVLTAAFVVVSASTRPEAFGRTLAEGLAMGRPVVGPDHGGAVEIVTQGHTGWLFAPGNSESLSRALLTALSLNSGARHRLADEAIHRIHDEFQNQQMCAKTLEVYSEVLFGEAAGEGAAA